MEKSHVAMRPPLLLFIANIIMETFQQAAIEPSKLNSCVIWFHGRETLGFE